VVVKVMERAHLEPLARYAESVGQEGSPYAGKAEIVAHVDRIEVQVSMILGHVAGLAGSRQAPSRSKGRPYAAD